VTLRSPADAYVRDGSHSDTNFGQAGDLQVKTVSAPGWSRESYVRFDLAGVNFSEGIDSATLRLFGSKRDTIEPSVTVSVYGLADQGWTEPGLTWDTRPAAGAAPVASRVITSGTATYHEFDVTEYLRQQQAAGATSVAFALRAPTVSEGWAVFNSDEAASNRPELVVDLPPAF
jgi:hyaluronate lyase